MAPSLGKPAYVICALTACAACWVPDRSIGIVNEQCLERVSEEVYHHACQHGRLGPYATVDAVATGTALPTVDSAQRVLVARLPPRELDPDGVSYLRYVASRDGQHVVFAGAENRAIAITIATEARGRRLPLTPIEPVPADAGGCGGMLDVNGIELTAGEAYVIMLGPTSATELRLFIEHLPTFDEEWSDQCTD